MRYEQDWKPNRACGSIPLPLTLALVALSVLGGFAEGYHRGHRSGAAEIQNRACDLGIGTYRMYDEAGHKYFLFNVEDSP